jgi:hypothetical protein
MKTTIALFVLASLVASADTRRSFEDFHADPERGIVCLPRTEHSDGKMTMTYLNVSQIVRVTLRSDGKDPDAHTMLIIVTSELEPTENVNQAIDSKHLTYEIRFPTREFAEAAIQKMFAKHGEPAGAGHAAPRSESKPAGAGKPQLEAKEPHR